MRFNHFRDVPSGKYHGTFGGVTKTSHPEYGQGVRLEFNVDAGEYAGATVCRTTKLVASKNNTCGRFLEMISGLPLDDAVKCDTDEWVGTPGTIVVETSPTADSIRVAEFVRDEPSQDSDNGKSSF